MTPEAATYLHEALDYIQLYALRSGDVDWKATRSEALARIQDAESFCRYVSHTSMGALMPGRSSQSPCQPARRAATSSRDGDIAGTSSDLSGRRYRRCQANSPAEHAGLEVRDIIEAINGELITQLDRVTFKRALYTSPVSLTFRRAGQESISSATLHAASYKRKMRPQGWHIGAAIGYLELPAVT